MPSPKGSSSIVVRSSREACCRPWASRGAKADLDASGEPHDDPVTSRIVVHALGSWTLHKRVTARLWQPRTAPSSDQPGCRLHASMRAA